MCRMFVAFLLFAATSASADVGNFHMRCFFEHNKCAALIRDIVSDRFTVRYPADQWQIVVIASVHRFSNGGGTAFAVAGVSPRSRNDQQPGIVPSYRFSSVVNDPGPLQLTSRQALNELEEAIRGAVENMMTACETSPECRLH